MALRPSRAGRRGCASCAATSRTPPRWRPRWQGHDVVIHLASNPDIARAAREPTIDFWQGTALTQSVVEAMRTTSAKRILYASGSGVYGDLGTREAAEDHGPLMPVVDLRRQQAGGRGADRELRRHVRPRRAARSGSATSSARARPTASASTSRARCCAAVAARRRAHLAAHPRRRQPVEVLHPRRRHRARRADRARQDAPRRSPPTTSRPATTSPSRRSPRWPSSASGCPPAASASTTRAATAAGRATSPSSASNTDRIRALGWRCERPSREALRQSILAMIPDLKAGRM